MDLKLIHLNDFRIPDYENARLTLDASPLAIIDTESLTQETPTSSLSVPISIATILYKWCPEALAAFLDLDAWFSLTWNVSLQEATPQETRLEIGRVGNQITFGSLDKDGDNWTLMLTYNIVLEGPQRGRWIPNQKESMQGDEEVTDPDEINRLARDFAKDLLLNKQWQTSRKSRHRFYIEYAPMDIWGDGIPMNPHWLYASLNLDECTTCHATPATIATTTITTNSSNNDNDNAIRRQRCGRCGTATYCSDKCQKRDWQVHKDTCTMSMEDRGQALKITEKGGLIAWDVERRFGVEESGEESKNPNFEEVQRKRVRRGE